MSTDTPLDEFDEIPDPFAGHDDIDWGRLLDAARHATPDYFPDEEPLDASFLAQLDLLDGTSSAAPSTSSLAPIPSGSSLSSGAFSDATTPPSTTSTDFSPLRIGLKRPQTQSPSLSPTGSRTSKQKKRRKSFDVAPLILTGFEEEMACSICCDIYVATHLLSPCGHSFCGECAWHWTAKINKTDCPLCRTRLAHKPMVPNICMDKMVDTHIQMLALHGDAVWREGGQKLAEFNARRRKWKDGAAERNRMPAIRTVPQILDWVGSDDSDYGEDEESGDDEEEDEVGGEESEDGGNLMGDLRTLSTRELQVLIENLRNAT
ncbi:hypothetical protein GGX14DRAFT_641400 [Mycena pura]|uniref:RING-type domain-containing protein n=1 Tax=Mycena pura TaxID=153505 RepID=A0AAD6YPY9_9AGAR|nr:hypothetical protein GGX14DRAFT_641400 [Mycena pura]